MNFSSDLIRHFNTAKRVTVLTGAGVSAESGVPTFRDALTGLWSKFRPEELATPEAFFRNPSLVWAWYEWRRKLLEKVAPNPAHLVLAEMEELYPEFHLLTQNVDGLHQRAGSRKVVELHGNIARNKCANEGMTVSEWTRSGEEVPQCPQCGGPLRPDVVWFGEELPVAALQQAEGAAQNCDLFLVIGTSAEVYPAAGLPVKAVKHGAILVEINPAATPISSLAHFVLNGLAGEILPKLRDQIAGDDNTASHP